MDDDSPCMPTRGSMDLIGRELKNIRGRGRGELPLPRRRRAIGEGGGSVVPDQIGVITGVIGAGATFDDRKAGAADTSFQLQDLPHVTLLLLTPAFNVVGPEWYVDNPDELTEEELEVAALDLRRDGNPQPGDVVRVWADDGKTVNPGDEVGGGRAIYCDAVNATDHLRSLPTWNLAESQILSHDETDDEIIWVARSDTGEVPPWVFDYPDDPIPGAGVAAGYAIDLDGGTPNTISFDPEEITGHAATFQIFMHASAETGPTGPNWKTVTGYNAAQTQQLIHISGAWNAVPAYTVLCTDNDTTASVLHDAFNHAAAAGTYVSANDILVHNETVGAAATDQKERLFVDVSAIAGYNGAVPQLLGHLADSSLKWDTLDNWLKLVTGYISGHAQSLIHNPDLDPNWHDDVVCEEGVIE